MGLYDRDYTQADSGQQYYGRHQYYGAPNIRFNMPRLTPVVKWLLIANISIFALGALIPQLGEFLENWFAVRPGSWVTGLQPWRIITYEFLHDRISPWHIFFNMFALFMFGPPLERHWGSRHFLPFYLICGATGAILYLLLVGVGFLPALPLIGASGSILGLLSACAILFPHFILLFFFFPVPIRVGAVALGLMYFLMVVMRSSNAGGDAAHLAGMATGAAYVLLGPKLSTFRLKTRAGSWEKKLEEERKLQIEVDRILAKVHQHGLHSLSGSEKRILKKATREELRRQSR
ncbi:MAG: rhomboid family intramembrane serine protease [Sedimentisphaerales bacterium]|nr:rhomboid family intramembrane serine protease [Sedimentisphaerales bacterium]